MLELRDAQSEIVDLGLLRDSEPPDDTVDNILATRVEPLALVTPSRERVTHRRSHRVAIDADPARQIVSQVVSTFNRQRRPAERGQQRLLQRASRLAFSAVSPGLHNTTLRFQSPDEGAVAALDVESPLALLE